MNEPVLLMVHGASSSAQTWWRCADWATSVGAKVLLIDLPGHGEKSDAQASIDSCVNAVIDLLKDVEEPCYGIGHSLGSAVLAKVAAAVGGAVRGLLLEEPPGPNSLDFSQVAAHLRDDYAAITETGTLPGERPSGWQSEDLRIAEADLRRCNIDSVGRLVEELAHGDVISDIRRCRVPVSLLLAADSAGRYGYDEVGSTLRGVDRRQLQAFAAHVDVVGTDHCVHRANFGSWCRAAERLLDLPREPATHRPTST